MRPHDAIRLRLRDLLTARGISQPRLCKLLSEATGEKWLVQRLGKVLNGHIRLTVEDMVLMCRVADISLVELVRDPGRELVADLTPSELRMVQATRDYPNILLPVMTLVNEMAGRMRRPSSRETVRDQMRRARREREQG